MKPFDENLYICETCHQHFAKNKISGQAVGNKMELNPTPGELKVF